MSNPVFYLLLIPYCALWVLAWVSVALALAAATLMGLLTGVLNWLEEKMRG